MRKIIITAGGTSEYIDGVRKITNSSSGLLGSLICEEVLKKEKDCKIFYIHSKNAKKISNEKVKNIEVTTTEDVQEVVKNILKKENISIFIHSMAISDYKKDFLIDFEYFKILVKNGVNPDEALDKAIIENTGKVKSSYSQLGVILDKTPKIIDMVKKLSPYTFLVGFKLLDNVEENELFEVGFNLLRKSRCNLVLANDIAKIRKGNHRGMIIYPEKTKDIIDGKKNISEKIVDAIYNRVDCKHPKSIKIDNNYEIDNVVFDELKNCGAVLFEKKLLPEVANHNDYKKTGTYGNLSLKKDNNEFIISGRNVHKGYLKEEDLCLIKTVEFINNKSIYSNVMYKGRVKPSIDSSIHAKLYEITDAKSIIHIHTNKLFLGVPTTDYNYPCGSEEEMNAIVDSVKSSNRIIQLYKHGLIILGNSLSDCLNKLEELFRKTPYINYDMENKDILKKGKFGEDESFLEHVEKTNALFVFNRGSIFPVEFNNETIGHIWEDFKETEINFALNLFPTSKGFNIVQKYIFTNDKKELKLFTTDKCNISQLYKNKYGFTLLDKKKNIIILKK